MYLSSAHAFPKTEMISRCLGDAGRSEGKRGRAGIRHLQLYMQITHAYYAPRNECRVDSEDDEWNVLVVCEDKHNKRPAHVLWHFLDLSVNGWLILSFVRLF